MDASLLPTYLSERVLRPAPGVPTANLSGRYVLYWARTALRAHENPALDVAVVVATSLGIPVFVYHALAERYPYASDRHHMFILEGARDFANELAARNIGTAFHLEREGHRGAHLRTLASNAALVVTELIPVSPLREWTTALSTATSTPVWEVDTACVVPVTLTTTGYDRAFVYRDATKQLRAERVSRSWPEVHVAEGSAQHFVPPLPFEPVDLAAVNFAELIGQCRIDHSVGPVADTRGGSEAGYARWRAFVDSGRIDRYNRTRNDPACSDGVSRLSAYLHYGMVSPFRVAREASARPGDGAVKWLDELLVWREVAYTFCHHRAEHATVHALPQWARETLAQHEGDARTLLDWECLARGQTPDAFWNAMQHSLLAHGELHNSVRMTWGKAIAGWTNDAAETLATLIDLNHRFALDGRDPASYGGILWCLGQFDRPFTPETRVLGTVRSRPSAAHAARIDVDEYKRHVRRPAHAHSPRVAVIGAGLAGLICARTLADHGVPVTVFEKSRGLGGRCATRREGPWQFDHGAQYFTVRDARLAPTVNAWHQRGLVAPWSGSLVTYEAGTMRPAPTHGQRWVGVPGMSALGKHLGDGLDVALETTVSQLLREGSQWRLVAGTGADLGTFDVVLAAMPSPQVHALFAPVAPTLAEQVGAAIMYPTWATMLVLADRPAIRWNGAFLKDDAVLSWVCRDASKPSRGAHETWVLHASRKWSVAHLEDDPKEVSLAMTASFERLIGDAINPVHCVAHRWRYALADLVGTQASVYDAHDQLGAAGDWCGGPRIEGALLSGLALAGQVLRHAHQHAGGKLFSNHRLTGLPQAANSPVAHIVHPV
ncbi:MAG: FAD-dependent oxidoreductase [Phycisphaerae bacterium]|nr:FAD-dependent oxidoreductase [Gemmatimonadaceae bacterium]